MISVKFTSMSTGGQGTKWLRNIAEYFNHLSRVHERYRRQTDDRRQTDGRRHIANKASKTFAIYFSKCKTYITRKHIQLI